VNIQQIVELSPVIPVITIDDSKDALPLGRALLEGGVPVMEITLRTPAALAAIEIISGELPEMVVGAGTVLNPADVDRALTAGSRFIVSPAATESLCTAATDTGTGFLPGAMTPSDMMFLLEKGFRCQKFFPADVAGGADFLKAVASPLAQIRFCPTGGINPDNARRYLALKNVSCVGGSWLAPPEDIRAQKFDAITQRCRRACALRSAPTE